MLTDIFLMLDRKLDKKALKPDLKRNETKMSLAAAEAVKAKRLLGALRSLWRSSAIKGQDGHITHLKSFLVSSPQQRRNVDPSPLAPPPVDDENCSDDEGSADDRDHDGVDGGDRSTASYSDSDDPNSDDDTAAPCAPLAPADPAGTEEVECSQATSIDSSGACSVGTLDASTLHLGTPTPPPIVKDSDSDSENFRDSQVPGAGWMGQAMIASRYLEKEEKERMETHQHLTSLVSSIREVLGYMLFPAESADGAQMEDYAAWCYKAFEKHGVCIYDKLADVEFFKRWALQQKEAVEEDWYQKNENKFQKSESGKTFCRDGINTNCGRFAK